MSDVQAAEVIVLLQGIKVMLGIIMLCMGGIIGLKLGER